MKDETRRDPKSEPEDDRELGESTDSGERPIGPGGGARTERRAEQLDASSHRGLGKKK
jgi:hypothetical protein